MSNLWHRARASRDHRWTPRRMSDYLDGEMPTRGQRRLERHVVECDECRGLLKGLQQMLGKLRGAAPPETRPDPHEMAARVRDRLREHPDL